MHKLNAINADSTKTAIQASSESKTENQALLSAARANSSAKLAAANHASAIVPLRRKRMAVSAPNVAVIGGGPGGLAAAARLIEAGASVELFEASGQLGGLARSIELWGRQLELSAHIFRSSDPFVNRLWHECAGELKQIALRRGIFDGESVIEYPMTPLRIFRNLGAADTVRSVVGLGMGRVSQHWSNPPKNAEDWMVRMYGRPLHERFLRDYAEKLWGVPCDQIGASFPQFLFQSADDAKGDESFYYPTLGNSSVWNRLGDKLASSGAAIHLKTRVNQLQVQNNRVTGLVVDGKRKRFDHVISTMPLGLLARLTLPENVEVKTAASELRARSTVLVYLLAKSDSQSKYNWLTVYPARYRMGRITDFGQWLGENNGHTVFCLEYWCDKDDALWSQDNEAITAHAIAELNQTGQVGKVVAVDSHIERLPGTHPVFSLGAQQAMNIINDKLSRIDGLSTVGRHGSHGVLGMGESMEAASAVADAVMLEAEQANACRQRLAG